MEQQKNNSLERRQNVSLIDSRQCTGCAACAQICPQKCIGMLPDQKGFLVPSIDSSSCLGCGLCLTSCQIKNEVKRWDSRDGLHYITLSKNRRQSVKSASGGVFVAIASYIIQQKQGVVFGCAFDDNLHPRHVLVSELPALVELQNSKYVQSEIGETYEAAKQNLEQGQWVLFSGTPCQVAGLKRYLGQDYPQLLTIDLICHGVPSPGLFARYVEEQSKEKQGQLKHLYFRRKNDFIESKSAYWMTRIYRRKLEVINSNQDVYYSLFLKGQIFRDSCYQCPYASLERVGDITIGDCDSAREYPHFHPYAATSTLLLNTPKSRELWAVFSVLFEVEPLDLHREASHNHQLLHPSKRPTDRDQIYQKLLNLSWKDLEKQYAVPLSRLNHLKTAFRRWIPMKWVQIYCTKLKVRKNDKERI
jgi:NAD-dependent dihydropyrimidine dehydrogenase PreA subunit